MATSTSLPRSGRGTKGSRVSCSLLSRNAEWNADWRAITKRLSRNPYRWLQIEEARNTRISLVAHCEVGGVRATDFSLCPEPQERRFDLHTQLCNLVKKDPAAVGCCLPDARSPDTNPSCFYDCVREITNAVRDGR